MHSARPTCQGNVFGSMYPSVVCVNICSTTVLRSSGPLGIPLAVIVAPRWTDKSWFSFLRDMPVLKTFAAGSSVFIASDGKHIVNPWPVDVYYDAPVSVETDTNSLPE